MLDLLIRNGLVIDGAGNPGYFGAVGVEGDTLRMFRGDVGNVQAARVIDATDHVVSPGFIDLHSHGGLTIIGEPRHEPKVRQGVTTELVGIDGNSAAPHRTQEELHRFIELDRGLNGAPPMPATWLGVGECLSTGLDYPPGAYADTDELIELSKVAADMGGFYHTHTRASLAKQGLLAPWEEALEIGRKSGIPVHLTHYQQRSPGVGSHLDFLGLVEDARDEGMDVTFDCYPYMWGSTRAIISIPNWAKDGGPERLKEALSSPDDRARLREEMSEGGAVLGRLAEQWLTYFRKPNNKQYEGHTLAEIARTRGQDELDAFFDLLLDEDLAVCAVAVGTNPHTLPAFVSHPYGMVGSDALLIGDFPSPRTYGCFPVILAEFVRAEKHLRLPEAIRKMTSFAAQRLGLTDRGLLRDGMKADIAVFNPKTIKAPATRANPKQFPLGIPYVIVNGKVVVDGGEHTGALPGLGLRHRH